MSPIEPRTAVVEIFTGDYLDRIQYLEQKAKAEMEAADAMPRIEGDVPAYVTTAQEHDDLVREAKSKALNVKLQALGRRAWKDLVAAHPPRKAGDGVTEEQAEADARNGVNLDAFKDALVEASIVDPALSSEDLDQLADVDFDRLYMSAFALNRGMAPDPKASLVSRLTQKNDETSS